MCRGVPKVDRQVLPLPAEGTSTLETTFVAPRGPMEEAVAGIWQEVLGIDQVGIHDNFFDLGGHSLLATRVISRLRKKFKVDFPLRAIFDHPLLKDLAKTIEDRITQDISALSNEEVERLLGKGA